MTSLKTANRRVGSLFAVAALVLSTITPGLVPAFASAAQLTERSVALSSSSKAATGVSYTINFTPDASAAAVVLNFCSNTPLIGEACDEPTGFSATGVGVSAAGFTDAATTAAVTNGEDNAIVLTGSVADAATTIELVGVTNPDAASPLYVRIVTYSDASDALLYEATNLGDNVVDQGSAAVSITDTIGVSGAVLETMTFCVAGNIIDRGNCTTTDNGGVLKAPTLKLGEGSGDVLALTSSNVSTGSLFSQISTNASSGAIVSLKSSALACGGLVRAGAPSSCDIAPALAGGVAANEAKFGAQVASATNPGGGAVTNGIFRAYSDTPYYSDSVFKLNFVTGDGTGITSPYGDPFLDTDDGPASNKNVQITFGASISNQTPAGLYSTDLSLIATGKF